MSWAKVYGVAALACLTFYGLVFLMGCAWQDAQRLARRLELSGVVAFVGLHLFAILYVYEAHRQSKRWTGDRKPPIVAPPVVPQDEE